MAKTRIVLKWIGYQRGIEGRVGWPARDLTQEDVARFGLDKDELIASGLYEEVIKLPDEEASEFADEESPKRRGKRGHKEPK